MELQPLVGQGHPLQQGKHKLQGRMIQGAVKRRWMLPASNAVCAECGPGKQANHGDTPGVFKQTCLTLDR